MAILIGKFLTHSNSDTRAFSFQGGRLFKFKGKVVSAAPAALMVSVSAVALSVTPVQADEISTVLTTPQTFAADVDHSITATGAINIMDSSTAALTIATDYSSTFTNAGTISLTGSASEVTGIFLEGDLLAGGVINNSGTISIDVAYDYPEVSSLYVEGDVAGSINNTETISAYALGTSETVSAWGIYVDGEMSATGQIVNSGTITVKAEQTDDYTAYAYGIEVEGGLNGLISNSGTISVTAISTESAATAYGINVDSGAGATARILSAGTITVNATSTSTNDSAVAYGINVDGKLAGLIENSGTISVTATSEYYSYADGIVVDDDLLATGSILNSGAITAKGLVGETGDTAGAAGIWVGGHAYGLINNSGTIDVEAIAVDDAKGNGIHVKGGLSGSILNSGTITAVAESGSDSASAYGIYVEGDTLAGAIITNSGTISVTAEVGTSEYAYAAGLWLSGNVAGNILNSGTITAVATSLTGSTATVSGYYISSDMSATATNSGTITATASAGEDDATAYGYYIGGVMSGTFNNSGMITATASTTDTAEKADAYGVILDDMTGTFANSGTITATATAPATGEANAYGLYVDAMDGEITDLGTIIVSAADDEYAVYLVGGTGTMHVNTDDDVGGLMGVEDHTVELLASGASNVFRFEDDNNGGGAFNTSVSDQTSAWFVQDEGGAMPIYAAVATGDLNISANVIADFGAQLGSFADQLGSGDAAPGVSRNAKAMSFLQPNGALGGLRQFASVGGQHFSYDATGNIANTNVNIGNAAFGMTGTMGNGMDVAFGLGVLTASGRSTNTEFDTTGFYLGSAIGTNYGGFDVDAGLGFGLLDTDKSRTINSVDTANASFESNFVTAHLGAQRGYQVNPSLTFTGFGQLRYTRQNDGAYTETGTIAAATVAERTIGVTEATFGIEARQIVASGGILTGHLTAVSRAVGGDDHTSVTVFRSSADILSADADFTGVSVGIGYETEIADVATLTVGLDHDLGDDGSGPNLSAGLSWSF